MYHRKKGHMLEQCFTFRRIFGGKHKADEIMFQEGANMMMISHRERQIEKDEQKQATFGSSG